MKDLMITPKKSMQPLLLQIYDKNTDPDHLLFQKCIINTLVSNRDLLRQNQGTSITSVLGSANISQALILDIMGSILSAALLPLTVLLLARVKAYNVLAQSNTHITCQLLLTDGTQLNQELDI